MHYYCYFKSYDFHHFLCVMFFATIFNTTWLPLQCVANNFPIILFVFLWYFSFTSFETKSSIIVATMYIFNSITTMSLLSSYYDDNNFRLTFYFNIHLKYHVNPQMNPYFSWFLFLLVSKILFILLYFQITRYFRVYKLKKKNHETIVLKFFE